MYDIEDIIKLIKGDITKKDREFLKKAHSFAEKAHKDQKRMDGSPYFSHVYETAKILAELGMDIPTVSTGFLHDVLEDTPVTEEEMEKEFGPDIVFLVNGVTKLGTLKYRGHERHVESLRKFFVAMTNDLRVVIVKLADRLHNLRTLEHVREDKRRRIALESLEVYAPLANRLGMGELKGKIEDAAFPYVYPKECEMVKEILEEKTDFYKKYLREVYEDLEKELNKNNLSTAEINYRMKHKYSLWKKLVKYDMDVDKVHDIIALRVIVDSVEDCYRVLGIVHSIWKPLTGRIKDYIAVPKLNGYRSVHTTVFTGSGGIAEIQIRTRAMHTEAEFGVAAHFAYKEEDKKTFDEKSKFKWIEELKDFNYELNNPKQYLEQLKRDFFNDRIFVFTPKGDVIDLPEDSSPIDFAYAVHSDIGDHTVAAKVNGKMVPIFSKLKNSDIVEITTKKDARPSSKWLAHAKTNVAKKNIRSYLEKNSLLNRLKSFGKNS